MEGQRILLNLYMILESSTKRVALNSHNQLIPCREVIMLTAHAVTLGYPNTKNAYDPQVLPYA